MRFPVYGRNFPQNTIKSEGRFDSGMQFHPVNIIYLHYHETRCNFLRGVSGGDACYVDYSPYARTVFRRSQ